MALNEDNLANARAVQLITRLDAMWEPWADGEPDALASYAGWPPEEVLEDIMNAVLRDHLANLGRSLQDVACIAAMRGSERVLSWAQIHGAKMGRPWLGSP